MTHFIRKNSRPPMSVGVGVASDGADSFEVRAKERNSWQAVQTGEYRVGLDHKCYPHNKKRRNRHRSDMLGLARHPDRGCHSGSGKSLRAGVGVGVWNECGSLDTCLNQARARRKMVCSDKVETLDGTSLPSDAATHGLPSRPRRGQCIGSLHLGRPAP